MERDGCPEQEIIQHCPAGDCPHIAANVLDNAVEGILVCTPDARIISVNKAFTRITGYEAREALGQTLDILLSEWEPVTSHFEIYSTVREHGYWRGNLWSRRKNGEHYVQSRSVSAVRDEAGQTTHFIIVFSDLWRIWYDTAGEPETTTWPRPEHQTLKEHA